MSATFYDLLKFAKTGIAAPSMTQYDKLKALSMCKAGFPVATISGVPPISFKSDGSALTAWSISGNMVQSSVPTPSAPITPEETGDKTANQFDISKVPTIGQIVNNGDGTLTVDGYPASTSKMLKELCPDIKVDDVIVYNMTTTGLKNIYFNNAGESYAYSWMSHTPLTVTHKLLDSKVYFYKQTAAQGGGQATISYIMINLGSTVLDYKPYGYALPITLAGQTQTVYLSEPLRKIGDYGDTVASDGTVVRRIKKIVLDGTEAWEDRPNYTSAARFVRSFNGLRENYVCVCTHMVGVSASTPTYPNIWINSGVQMIVNFSAYGTTTVEDFKQWLADEYSAGHPVEVWYVLASPTTETVTVPTITPQKGSNTLTIGTTLPPSEVSITGGIK